MASQAVADNGGVQIDSSSAGGALSAAPKSASGGSIELQALKKYASEDGLSEVKGSGSQFSKVLTISDATSV